MLGFAETSHPPNDKILESPVILDGDLVLPMMVALVALVIETRDVVKNLGPVMLSA